MVLEAQKRRSNNHQEWKLLEVEAGLVIENRETGLVLGVVGNKEVGVAGLERKSKDALSLFWRHE